MGSKIKNEILSTMLNCKGLKRLKDITPEKEFWVGALFREFNVKRLDSKSNIDDYYDLMFIESSIFTKDVSVFVNVTFNSDNRGKLVAIIPNAESKYSITAKQLQDFFSDESEIYYIENIDLCEK